MAIHTKGGSDSPYEKFHLSKQAKANATRLATNEVDGLMPKELYGFSEQVSPPSYSGDTGLSGQWAQDTNYMYWCIGTNQWVRIELYIVKDLGYLLTEEEDIGEDPFTLAFDDETEDGSLWKAEVFSE